MTGLNECKLSKWTTLCGLAGLLSQGLTLDAINFMCLAWA